MSNYLIVKDKVQRFAREVFQTVQIDADGDLSIPYESTTAFISVSERDVDPEMKALWDENQLSYTLVNVWAPVIVDVKPSDDLYKWVATEGQDYIYGTMKVVPFDDKGKVQVIMSMTLPGDTLDPGELKNALFSVCLTADSQDEVLQKKFGGKRVEDLRS